MALHAEPVERAAHVELFAGAHVEQREVNRRAARMTAFGSDISTREQLALGNTGIEIRFHQRVGHIGRPAHEMVHCLLRAISVINLQPVTPAHHLVAHSPQTVGGAAREQCHGLLISVHARAHKIIGAVIAHLEYGIGHCLGQHDKLAIVFLGGGNSFGPHDAC